jgi:hypothetical protein
MQQPTYKVGHLKVIHQGRLLPYSEMFDQAYKRQTLYPILPESERQMKEVEFCQFPFQNLS